MRLQGCKILRRLVELTGAIRPLAATQTDVKCEYSYCAVGAVGTAQSVLSVVLVSVLAGQLCAQDTLPWISDMNRRMNELTRREMAWRPTLLVTTEGENWSPVRTVEDAIHILCLPGLSIQQEVMVYNFLDSAATELWRFGTPILLSTCHHILHPDRMVEEERASGYQFVCVAILCSPGTSATGAIAAFNHRTRVLLQASAPLRAAHLAIGRKRLTVGCDSVQAIDRTNEPVLNVWSAHWDSLMLRMPDEMLAAGAPKREVRKVAQEQRVWLKTREQHCASIALGLPEDLHRAKMLSCKEWAGRCRMLELSQTFHLIVPRMWYRDAY